MYITLYGTKKAAMHSKVVSLQHPIPQAHAALKPKIVINYDPLDKGSEDTATCAAKIEPRAWRQARSSFESS
jgi:hypothetical protein